MRRSPCIHFYHAPPLTWAQVYRRFLSALGPRHADTADILYNIGLLHKDLLDFGAADQYLRSALDIYIKVHAALFMCSSRHLKTHFRLTIRVCGRCTVQGTVTLASRGTTSEMLRLELMYCIKPLQRLSLHTA